ncbi:MAG TPA: flagellar basal body-associated FliL family protein [Xanthobacteraceae bacterium]|nr:flagellar basal body-associated FliL family protein [Xanthobacteraceae bacterium]
MAAKANKKPDPEATDETEDGEEGSGQPKRKLPLKLIAIAAAGLLLLGGGGVAAYVVFGGKKDDKAVSHPVSFLDLPEVLINLSGPGGERVQYLKLKIVLELSDQTVVAQVQPVMPRVMDTFQTYLRELRPADLEGSAGLYRLRDELTRRVNAVLAPNRINAVLFKEVVLQ